MFQKFQEPSLIHVVKEALYICLQYIVHTASHYRLVDVSDHVVRTSARPEPIGTVQKSRFIHFSQHVGHYPLNESVFVCGYSQRPQFTVGLWYVRAPHRLRDIAVGLHPLHQIKHIVEQVFVILALGDTVNARCLSGILPVVRRHEAQLVYSIYQRQQSGIFSRLIPYRFQLMCHAFRVSSTLHVSYPRLFNSHPLRSICFHRLHHYYEMVRLLAIRQHSSAL